MRALILAALLLATPAAAQVGRLSEATGPVQVREDGRGWSALPRGTLLRDGQSLRTLGRSQAEVDLGPNRLGLDPDTVLRIDSANPAAPAFTLEQGRAMLLLRSLQPGQEARVGLRGASVALIRPGLYVIDSGGEGRPASLGVTRGLAQAAAPGASLVVQPGQTGVLDGAGRLRQGVAEGFLADDPNPPLPQIVRPLVPPAPAPGYGPPQDLAELPGGEALLREGQWAEAPEYGTVWYPPVAPGWSPYNDPWNERAAWGYAPWHYGSWIAIGPRWAWLPPPRHHYPYYARGYRPPPYPEGRGRPPPAVAQPNRPAPFWGNPPRAAAPASAPGGPPPRPDFWGRPQGAPVPQAAPQPVPAVQAPPPRPDFWGRPQGAPVQAPPAYAAPRPPPMAPAPSFAPPPRPAAPPPAPARRCGILGAPC